MTEKRYKMVNTNLVDDGLVYYLIKKDGRDVCQVFGKHTAKAIVTELNALHEENVKLQARNKYLATKIQRERNSYQKQHEKWEKEIQKENEQLKAQLYCDDEGGVCNICKHHYLVKDDEAEFGYYNSRCKKGHYECARVSLRHCEDFEGVF